MAAKKKTVEEIQYLTIKQVCEKTTYSRKSIEKFIREGLLKKKKLNGGRVVVDQNDFLEFIEKIAS